MQSTGSAAVGLKHTTTSYPELPPLNLAKIAELDNHRSLSRSLIESTLTASFGPRIAKSVLETHGNPHFSVLEFKKLLINVAANVRREDLEELFWEIHKGNLKIAGDISTEERRAICATDRFEDLQSEQLAILLKPWRGDARLPLFRALFPIGVQNDVAEWVQNCQMLESFECVRRFCVDSGTDLFDPAMKRLKNQLASHEYLSRMIAPHLPDPQTRIPEEIVGTLVPVLTSERETSFYEIKGVMSEQDMALYVLVPLTMGQFLRNEKYPVIALFRDLAPKSRELTSWEVDARADLFDRAQDKIKSCIAACLPREPCLVTCLGDSTASIDAQLLAALIVRERNDNWVLAGQEPSQSTLVATDTSFMNVKKLSLCAWDPEVISAKRDGRYTRDRAGLDNAALEIEKYFVFFAKPFAPTYHGTWLGYQDSDTQIVKISLVDLQTSYGRAPDPKTCMAFTQPVIDVELIERERRTNVLRAQKGYTWALWKGPTAISRTFFKNILPTLIRVQNEVPQSSS